MPSIHGPAALYPRGLNELSAQLLPRLRRIPEYRCWLPSGYEIDTAVWNPPGRKTAQTSTLWHCLAQGAPLIILLDLLGSKTGGSSLAYKSEDNKDSQAVAAGFVVEFQRRVEILEAQGHLSYGEVFRVHEFLSGSCSEFIKVFSHRLYAAETAKIQSSAFQVLRTVQRVLGCLEATYPNLYDIPDSPGRQQEHLFDEFNEQQINYLEDLKDIKECVETLHESVPDTSLVLEYVSVHVDRMILYQEHIINYLRSINVHSTDSIRWSQLFGIKEHMFILGSGAYRSYCSQFFSLMDFTDAVCLANKDVESLCEKCFALSQQLTFPVDHVFSFIDTCSSALEITHPIENTPVFDALCSAHLALQNLKDDILEIMRSKRTAYAKRFIRNNTPYAHLNPDCLSLGELVLDDIFRTQFQNSSGSNNSAHNGGESDKSQTQEKKPAGFFVYAFLFQDVLLLGKPIVEEGSPAFLSSCELRTCYSGNQWDLGPAIRNGSPFDVLCAISLAEIVHVSRPDIDDFVINLTWTSGHEGSTLSTIALTFYDRKQLDVWIRALSHLVPGDCVLADIFESEECDASTLDLASSLSWLDELDFNRRCSGAKVRPWSLIARKESALSSSLYLFTCNKSSEPSIFSALSSSRSRKRRFEVALSASPRSLSSARSQRSAELLADPRKLTEAIQSIDAVLRENIDEPPDLTGQIRRIGNYPAAHGGFSDVWKCNWITGTQCHKVAVKVLRGKLLDIEREDKMAKRLHHEIKVWKQLEHENVVPLMGTCSDFGRYISLVCPWYENGSLFQYMKKQQDILKLVDRLKLLSEIAAGLAYLHSRSIVHGDLSSANILIDDDGHARLGDFGLSTLVEDLVDSGYPSSMLGGAIRWSAPELYCVSCFDYDHADSSGPRVSVSSDIYSYGSIALEVLSGKVPYYHLKHDGQVLIELSKRMKPQRTASPFLTNDLWELIRECWNDNPSARPSTGRVSSQICLLHQRTLARHSIHAGRFYEYPRLRIWDIQTAYDRRPPSELSLISASGSIGMRAGKTSRGEIHRRTVENKTNRSADDVDADKSRGKPRRWPSIQDTQLSVRTFLRIGRSAAQKSTRELLISRVMRRMRGTRLILLPSIAEQFHVGARHNFPYSEVNVTRLIVTGLAALDILSATIILRKIYSEFIRNVAQPLTYIMEHFPALLGLVSYSLVGTSPALLTTTPTRR
ncbi:uncharacterized protein FOMMEDRAFT_154445 [Fomitiporia mediterranea MF3/22]|uniref:uncharacterized protein n=1 Tax=Fomitiporia mediterranea (strain MF3/22) TaxID=694068 RepID=UPI0004407A51|nr:uncharacterized protein FOMMEDRAFT_154445 [Fomitiporia mediterranea MF3/22]EJD05232.1 hypothetical protein FOMMEDRAFT_154445 [Fomitiporia mediterranea MF3/22]